MRSRTPSRSKNRDKNKSRSSSREKGGYNRNKYTSERGPRKGKFDIEPPQGPPQREGSQTMNVENVGEQRRSDKPQSYTSWSEEGINISGRAPEAPQSYNKGQTRFGSGGQVGNPAEPALKYIDLKRQYEQSMQGKESVDTSMSQNVPSSIKEESQRSFNGYPPGNEPVKIETKQSENEMRENKKQFYTATNNPDIASVGKQPGNQRSRFSYTADPNNEKPQESQQGTYSYTSGQQLPQYSNQMPQYQNQSQPQGQNLNPNQNQGQNQTQYYSQMQYPYQYQSSQNQQYQSAGSQFQNQQNQYQYRQQQEQQQQQSQSSSRPEGGSRFSSKPYNSDNQKFSRGDRYEGQDKGRSDNENKYRENVYYTKQNQDDRDTREGGRNTNPRTYESGNYKKQNYRSDNQRRYNDSGYNQGSGGKYKVHENYMGKKVITTKSNSGYGQNYYSNNSGGYYKDRNKEGGSRGGE